MTRAALALFLLESSAGLAFLLLFFPTRSLGKGFFTLHGATTLVFLAIAVALGPPGNTRALSATAAGLALLYALLAHGGHPAAARPVAASIAAIAGYAAVRIALSAPAGEGTTWAPASALLGGLFFAAVLLVMNLGHWYLVSRSLPFQLLARGAALFAALAVARVVFLAVAVVANPRPEGREALLSLDRDALFFLFRVVWGIVGPLALSFFVWRTAEMKSNQAATGLLYVALVFVLVGELLAAYLTVATGFPV
jgi:hypothetical protein